MALAAYAVTVALFWVAAGVLSWLSWRNEALGGHPFFLFPGLLVGWLLGVAAAYFAVQTGLGLLITMWGVAFGGLLLAPFAVKVGLFAYDGARRWLASEANLRVPSTYDRAEAAEKARQWDRAIRLYREASLRDPSDAVFRLRIAEVEYRRGRLAEAAAACREALPFLSGRERAATIFRISEFETERGRPDVARGLLEEYLESEPDDQLKDYARSRLRTMGAR
ncbi:MAG: tetratricopeptide repeat protein [Planctomycetes bacterium]|nr:tetratricopeptide repeat protein [Planctomycetota bacterium]